MPENRDFAIEFIALAIIAVIIARMGKSLHKDMCYQKTRLIFTALILNYKIKILKMELLKQQFADTILKIVDHATGAPIDATFENVVLESSDPAVFTCTNDVNNDGKVDVVGVAEGTATLNVSVDATYIDGNTGQSVTKTKTASLQVTVSAPPPEAQSTDLVVTFTAPEAVPAPTVTEEPWKDSTSVV